MEKCLACKKQIEEGEDNCHTCKNFLQWKHKKNYNKIVEEFRKLSKEFTSKSTKLCRRYKNE